MKMNKNILIWGASVKGKETYEILCQSLSLKILAFGDNDINKHNRKFCGKRIINAEDLDTLEGLDLIIIASVSSSEIKKKLKCIVDVPIYENVYEFINIRASIDISGWCNAHCKWCATGIKNNQRCIEEKYMSFEKFKEIYNHLIDSSIIFNDNELLLYSWGEPYLNPDCLKIYEYLSQQGQVFSISTNASVLKLALNAYTYKKCKTITFSMSGFYQKSYGKIHGFNVEKIKKNIVNFVNNIRKCGFCGEFLLSYHVYQFNQDEIVEAKKFADSLNMKFIPVYALFASYEMAYKYLMNTLQYDILKEAGKDMILFYLEELLKKRPANYSCLLENMISINTDGNIELCCCSDDSVKDYEWGSVLNIKSVNEWKILRKRMLRCSTCKECEELGIGYWCCNSKMYHC
ncbi:radical SAM protein [Clostridium neonatale]|uniref:radical SAM protein n=1 Tax=Clostridium neonatale TaxID=137838 RepID=UPI003D32842C